MNIFRFNIIRYLIVIVFILTISLDVFAQSYTDAEKQDNETTCVLGEHLLTPQGNSIMISGGGSIIIDRNHVLTQGGLMDLMYIPTATPMLSSIVETSELDAPRRILMLVIDDYSSPLSSKTLRSHGDYVFETATVSYRSIYDDQFVAVHQVDYGPKPTLESVVESTIDFMDKLPGVNTFDYVVLNLSWVILPCKGNLYIFGEKISLKIAEYLETIGNSRRTSEIDLDGDGIISIVEYIIATNDTLESNHTFAVNQALALYLFNAYDKEYAKDIIRQFEEQKNSIADNEILQLTSKDMQLIIEKNDPFEISDFARFRQIIGGNFGGIRFFGKTYSLAAAGNLSLFLKRVAENFSIRFQPLAPARWSNVIAVSGSPANDKTELWAFSHHGQIKAPSAWHPTITDDYVSGTSFATPMASTLLSYVLAYRECRIRDIVRLDKRANKEFIEQILKACS